MSERNAKMRTSLRFRAIRLPYCFDGRSSFRNLQECFKRAWDAHPEHRWEAHYRFAGQSVRMRVVGRELAEAISRPFAHLLTDEGSVSPPGLRIDLWDESQTGIARPADQASALEEDLLAQRRGNFGSILGRPEDRFVGCRQPQTTTWLDRSRSHMIGWAAAASALTKYELGRPLYFPLLLWHNDCGVQVIHAGLVARAGQGVLLAGPADSGKSSAALTCCLRGGFDYLADDYVGLKSVDRHRFVGYSIYGSTWLMAEDLSRFPPLVSEAIWGELDEREKVPVLLTRVFPGRIARETEIRVLALPRVSEVNECCVRLASRSDALMALAPSSTIQIPVSSLRRLEMLAQLVESVPCYWLQLGDHRHLDSIPRCVEDLLSKAGLP